MPIEKLYQNRVVVLGKDYNDARMALKRPEVDASGEHDVTLVAADSQLTTILGGVAGMHVARVYVTPAAHRGRNYETARRALTVVCLRSGVELTHIDGDGGTYVAL